MVLQNPEQEKDRERDHGLGEAARLAAAFFASGLGFLGFRASQRAQYPKDSEREVLLGSFDLVSFFLCVVRVYRVYGWGILYPLAFSRVRIGLSIKVAESKVVLACFVRCDLVVLC